MTVFLLANNAGSTLSGPIATGATTINLAAGTGVLFPNPGVGQQFAMTIRSQSDATKREIVYCTARATDSCTVVRGQEGTTPSAFIAGDPIDNFLTAGTTAAFIQSGQLQQQPGNYAVDTGTVNNLVGALTPAPSSLALLTGSPIRIKVKNTNSGTSTLALTPLAATVITNVDGTVLSSGQIVANHVIEVAYNGSAFDLISQSKVFTDPNASGVTIDGTFNGNGANLLLRGSGSATPNKYIRALNGGLQFVNSAYSATIAALDDAGNLATGGAINAAGAVTAGGVINATGNITANFGKLRAGIGARGSGDLNAATILADFSREIVPQQNYIFEELPDGTIIQACAGITVTGGNDLVTFPIPFPNGCLEVLCMEGAPSGWDHSTGQLFPTVFGAQTLLAASFRLYCAEWTGGSFQYGPGITYRYIAIGY